jgi:transcriptional regulator with XRE-family HTH domain
MDRTVLRAWRTEQGLTLREAAQYLGTTKTSVYRWESGVHTIPTTVAILLCLLTENNNRRRVQDFLRSPL